MHIVICVNAVPDSRIPVAPGSGGSAPVVRGPYRLDDEAAAALEACIRLQESGRVASTSAISVGGKAAYEALVLASGMGASRVVWLAAGGTLSTREAAQKLARSVRGNPTPVDLVVCGRQSADFSSGQVPVMLAEFLGLPLIPRVRALEIEGAVARCEFIDHRERAIRARIPGPAVLACDHVIAEPRYVSLPLKRAARQRGIEPEKSACPAVREPYKAYRLPQPRSPGMELDVAVRSDAVATLAARIADLSRARAKGRVDG